MAQDGDGGASTSLSGGWTWKLSIEEPTSPLKAGICLFSLRWLAQLVAVPKRKRRSSLRV